MRRLKCSRTQYLLGVDSCVNAEIGSEVFYLPIFQMMLKCAVCEINTAHCFCR